MTKCYINEDKLFLRINDNTINLGFLDKNNIFIVEYLIYSQNIWDITKIMEYIKDHGTNKIEDLSNNNLITIANYGSQKIQGEIYKLFNEGSYEISKILNNLLFLSITQQKNIVNENNDFKEVYLINKKWLEEYEYNRINSLIKENDNILKDNEIINNNNLSYNSESINNIISKLDKHLLIEIDKIISIKKTNTQCHAKEEEVQLIDKKIKIYKDFLFINEQIYNEMKTIFKDFPNNINILYLSNWNKDLIHLNKYPQNTI